MRTCVTAASIVAVTSRECDCDGNVWMSVACAVEMESPTTATATGTSWTPLCVYPPEGRRHGNGICDDAADSWKWRAENCLQHAITTATEDVDDGICECVQRPVNDDYPLIVDGESCSGRRRNVYRFFYVQMRQCQRSDELFGLWEHQANPLIERRLAPSTARSTVHGMPSVKSGVLY